MRIWRFFSARRTSACPKCECPEIDFVEHAPGGQRWSLFRCPLCKADHWLPF